MIRDSKRKQWASSSPDLYPEIGFERTLGKVILDIIALSGREIILSDESTDLFSASFRKDRRIVELWTAADERIFISHFSMRGMLFAFHLSSDLREVARAVESWLMDELTLRDMKQRVPNLDVSELCFETEAGRGVEARWNNLLLVPYDNDPIRASWLDPECGALIRAASHRPLLRQLVPLVDQGCTLLFSRTLGYPYTIAGDCGIWATGGRYIAVKKDGSHLAEGTPEEMLDVLEGTLPPDIGPAIFGTADDLVA